MRHRTIESWSILINSGSIVGTTAVTSGLGFVYWWLAARLYPPEAVGLASAAVSAMLLLGALGVLGLGTLLIGELPRYPDRHKPLILTALVVAGLVGIGLGLVFAGLAPAISSDLRPLAGSAANLGLFALGVCLTAVGIAFDHAAIGLLRGGLQLWRNGLHSAVKIALLLAAAIWLASRSGLAVYAAWVLGALVSLAALAFYIEWKGDLAGTYRLEFGLVRRLGPAALWHHALNLALQAPALVLPLIVTALLSARMNAYFYMAWMVANFAFVGPVALTTVLYAVGSADPEQLAEKMRLTIKLSFLIGLLACGTLLISAGLILALFGPAYAQAAAWSLRLLGLGVFPLIVKVHYVALSRVSGRIPRAAMWMGVAALFEIGLAAYGASLGGLTGLSVGWLVAVSIEALFLARPVFSAAFPLRMSGKAAYTPIDPVRNLKT